jgi:hypothetical protein
MVNRQSIPFATNPASVLVTRVRSAAQDSCGPDRPGAGRDDLFRAVLDAQGAHARLLGALNE